jgi:hypothetical protein
VGEQSRGEFTFAIPTTRAGDAPVPADTNFAEVCIGSRLGLQSFNQERSLSSRTHFKLNRTAALAEWRDLCAG